MVEMAHRDGSVFTSQGHVAPLGFRDLSTLDFSPGDVVVIHDELDIDFGKIRLKVGGGEGGHNGLRSVANSLGSKDFARVRIGIGRPPGRMDPAAFVLENFTAAERDRPASGIFIEHPPASAPRTIAPMADMHAPIFARVSACIGRSHQDELCLEEPVLDVRGLGRGGEGVVDLALEIALAVRGSDAPRAAKDAYLEELLVRRELRRLLVGGKIDRRVDTEAEALADSLARRSSIFLARTAVLRASRPVWPGATEAR